MSRARPCLAQLSRICLYSNRSTPASVSARCFRTSAVVAARGPNAPKMLSKVEKGLKKASSNPMKNKKKGEEAKKKKKARTTYKQYDQRALEPFALLDAMR